MFNKDVDELFKRVKVYNDTEEGTIECPECGLPFTCIRKFQETKPKEGLSHD